MPIHAVIIDLGGVIMRTENRAPREHLAASLGMTYADLNQVIFNSESARLATVGKITTDTHWDNVRKMLKLSHDEFPRVPTEFWGGDHLDMDLVDYLRSLRTHYKTALLSNAWDNLRADIESVWKIADAFDEMIISAEVGVAKPDPRIFHYAIERLGVPLGEAVFVDDFTENVEAARSEGLCAIHFQEPDQARRELVRLLDHG